MLGIGKEAIIFLFAALSGIVIMLSYQILRILRKLVPHHIIIINVEDFFYWIAVSIFLFLQIYKATYGSIRWFFVLGVVCGVLSTNFVISMTKKMFKKIQKKLDKKGESR